jgi:uncharacterized protein YxjI
MPEKEFHIKQVLFSLVSDNFQIKLNGKEVYQVKGNGFEYGSQASFQTMDGTELAFLKQTNDTKITPWKNFEWIKDGKVWANAHQEKSYWGFYDKKLISVDIPGENDYKIVGDRMAWKFEVFKGDVKVGDIDKKWGFVDHYGVRVADGADEVDILLCGILIEHIYHNADVHRKPPESLQEGRSKRRSKGSLQRSSCAS